VSASVTPSNNWKVEIFDLQKEKGNPIFSDCQNIQREQQIITPPEKGFSL